MRPMVTAAGAGRGHLIDTQSLVPVVQELWNAWEIHFMILLSLSLQVFLFLFAGMRRRSSKWFLQTVLWLAYLSADSVAVFVLGHLAVRAREPGHELMSFWAPFVLVHLGGQETITAFSKQDNELWRRHLLNLVIQAGVAGYVVAKASWPDARLRAAMVIMFACGCLKYAERVCCLYLADTDRLRRWNKSNLRIKLEGWHQHVRGKGWFSRESGTRDKAEENMRVTLEMMKKGSSSEPPSGLFWDAVTLVSDIISMDAPLNQTQNITVGAYGDLLPVMLKGFLSSESRHSAYEHVGALLEHCYSRLYTKDHLRFCFFQSFDRVPHPILKTCLRISYLAILLLMVFSIVTATTIALALFRAAEKGGQLHDSSRVDITVTYLLLVGAIALDVSSAALFIFPYLSFYRPCLAKCIQSVLLPCCTKQWSQQLGQYNIINTAGMSFIGKWFACDVESKPVTKSIKEFILDTLLVSGTRKEWRIASTRGQLALHYYRMDHHQHDEHYSPDKHPAKTTTTLKLLGETFGSSADFPTSVLILHIATDICYHFGGTNHSDPDHDEAAVMKHKQTSTELSNYIMYLVFKSGVMLTINSQIVHDRTRGEIAELLPQPPNVHRRNKDAPVMKLFEAIKKQEEEDSMGEIQIRHHPELEKQQDPTTEIENQESANIYDDNTDDDDHTKKLKRSFKTLNSPVLPRAIAVAQELIGIKNEAERWELIAKVWAEMLYYTAPRCGGGFHYEHLSTGGEFVSHVLLLMYYLGPFLPPPLDA